MTMALSVGETLQAGKYRLDALLKAQSWGQTFLATHLGLDQQVVIKTFQRSETEGGPTSTQVNSFISFAQKLTRFHHPQLSRVVSVFEEADCACMVSEFIQGPLLSQLIQSQPLEEAIALRYIRQVAHGLHALHRHGLLHLNLRPDRIVLRKQDQSPVLIGLNARFSSQNSTDRAYLSLEQLHPSGKVGLGAEIYSLAATLYTLVTGEVPVIADQRYDTPLKTPRQIRPGLSKPLEQAILTGLALDPRDRPQRVKDWVQVLPNPDLPPPTSTTQLQVPPAWEVKLPAFKEAGIQQEIKTTLQPVAQGVDPSQTLLQVQSAPSPENIAAGDQSEANLVHSDAEDPVKVVQSSATTLQVATSPPPTHQPISEPPAPDVVPVATPSHLDATSPEAIAIVSDPSNPDPPTPTPAPSPPMIATSSKATQSQFPKWALFWCAVLAACGGLGAGLWFRINLTRQFAMPGATTESSPLDQLKSLETKEEKFLPTSTSVVPEKEDATQANAGYDTTPGLEGELSDPTRLTENGSTDVNAATAVQRQEDPTRIRDRNTSPAPYQDNAALQEEAVAQESWQSVPSTSQTVDAIPYSEDYADNPVTDSTAESYEAPYPGEYSGEENLSSNETYDANTSTF